MAMDGLVNLGARLRVALFAALLVLACAVSLAVASSAQAYIYWSNSSTGTIGRAALNRTGVTQNFITGANYPTGVAVDGTYIYWADTRANTIGRASLTDPSHPNTSFITGASSPTGVAVDGTYIYWSNSASGTISRAALNGTGITRNFVAATEPESVAVDAAHVYWTTGYYNSIGRASLADPGHPNQFFIYPASGGPIFGVAVDAAHIYWTNYSEGSIGRADLDGKNATDFISDTLTGRDTLGIAVDAAHIYWASSQTNALARANLDGTYPAIFLSAVAPYGVAVDATSGAGQTMPTSKAQCKHGGWRNYPGFKNQGACIRYVATHGKHPAGG